MSKMSSNFFAAKYYFILRQMLLFIFCCYCCKFRPRRFLLMLSMLFSAKIGRLNSCVFFSKRFGPKTHRTKKKRSFLAKNRLPRHSLPKWRPRKITFFGVPSQIETLKSVYLPIEICLERFESIRKVCSILE